MADQRPKRAERRDLVVFSSPAGVTDQVMQQLQERYGLEIQIRPRISAIDILGGGVDVAYDKAAAATVVL